MKSFVLPALFCILFVSISAMTADTDKPWDCPKNEVYYKCSLEKCYEYCEDLKAPKPCAAVASNCYKPACMCEGEMLRNKDGVCVPYEECD